MLHGQRCANSSIALCATHAHTAAITLFANISPQRACFLPLVARVLLTFALLYSQPPSPVRALHVPRALSFSFLPELGFFHSVRGIFQLSCSLFSPFIHRGKIALKNASLRRDKRRGSFIGRDLSLPDLARFAIARINRVAVYNGRTRALPPSVFHPAREEARFLPLLPPPSFFILASFSVSQRLYS